MSPDLALLTREDLHVAQLHHCLGEVGGELAAVRVYLHLPLGPGIFPHALIGSEQPQLVDDVGEVLRVELLRGFQVEVHEGGGDVGHGALLLEAGGEGGGE